MSLELNLMYETGIRAAHLQGSGAERPPALGVSVHRPRAVARRKEASRAGAWPYGLGQWVSVARASVYAAPYLPSTLPEVPPGPPWAGLMHSVMLPAYPLAVVGS